MKNLHFIPVAIAALFSLSACASVSAQTSQPNEARAAIASRDVIIDREGVKLTATILTPENAHGMGAVMIAGSGPADRGMIRKAAEKFASSGITVLIYDKRGSGDSTGNWMTSSLTDLAGDARAALETLSEQEASLIKTGFWMHSQGNWVAVRAMEIGAEPDFLIAVSGGGASPREVETYNYRLKLLHYSSAQQKAGMALVDKYFAYLGGEISRADFEALIADVSDQPWYENLGFILVSESNRSNWAWVANWDPAEQTAARGAPTLVMLGGLDHAIPLSQTVEDWNSQLTGGLISNNLIVTLPGREHHMNIVDISEADRSHTDASDDGNAHSGFQGMATDDDFWSHVVDWLRSLN